MSSKTKTLERHLTRLSADRKRFCRVDIVLDDGSLSICGVAGRTGRGQRRERLFPDFDGLPLYGETWGQCVEEIAVFYPELKPALPYHLNTMRAGCEHQRAAKWGEQEVELVTWKLTTAALLQVRTLKEAALESLARTGTATVDEATQRLLNLPYETTRAPNEKVAVYYEETRHERKLTTWVRPDEHPAGVLGKPCPTCGYKYGSGWMTEELPAEIVALVEGLRE